MNTEPNRSDVITDILTGFRSRMVAIVATVPPRARYVLAWGDGRFVNVEGGKTRVTGYERATAFDHDVAMSWLRRGLTDGAHVAPQIMTAAEGKKVAIKALRQAIDTVLELQNA